LSFLHRIRTSFRTYPASCSVGIGKRFPSEVKNEWTRTSSPPYAYVACTGTTL